MIGLSLSVDIIIDLSGNKVPNATVYVNIGDTLHIVSNDTKNGSMQFALFAGKTMIVGPNATNLSTILSN
jgi:hypothetical protein